MSNLRWETALRQTRKQNKTIVMEVKEKHKATVKREMLINQEGSSVLTESGYKMEIFISSKQCWPATITPASTD